MNLVSKTEYAVSCCIDYSKGNCTLNSAVFSSFCKRDVEPYSVCVAHLCITRYFDGLEYKRRLLGRKTSSKIQNLKLMLKDKPCQNLDT